MDDTFSSKRDRKLRKLILRTLHRTQIAPMRGLHADKLLQLIDDSLPPSNRFESEDHGLLLIRELEGKGMVALEDIRVRDSQRFGLGFLVARITAKGSANVNQSDSPDPDIEDDRIFDRNA